MAKIDRVKEFINYLKVILVLMLATNIGLIGWIANNYNTAVDKLIYLTMIVVFTLLVGIVFINKKIIKDIKSLEEL